MYCNPRPYWSAVHFYDHDLWTIAVLSVISEKKKEFREWRKKHYNEFQMMKKFREQKARDEEEEEEEGEGEGSAMDTV